MTGTATRADTDHGGVAAVGKMGSSLEREVAECLAALGVAPNDNLTRSLAVYLTELERWNGAYNLTAIRQVSDMVPQHIADSLALLPLVGAGSRWLDVGTGAGLPGIPLALARPDDGFTLVDSRGKKVRFLNHIVRRLALTNVRPVQIRIEDFRPRPGVDVVVARAFGSLAQLVQGLKSWCGTHTRILAMKGARPDDEIAALPADFALKTVHELDVPGLGAQRHVVELVRI